MAYGLRPIVHRIQPSPPKLSPLIRWLRFEQFAAHLPTFGGLKMGPSTAAALPARATVQQKEPAAQLDQLNLGEDSEFTHKIGFSAASQYGILWDKVRS